MDRINYLQGKIFNKIKQFSNNNFFFCTFSYSIGYGLLKFFKDKRNFIFIIRYFFKELKGILLINNYEILKNKKNSSQYSKVIFTWGNQLNLFENYYFDNYFKQKSSDDMSILWVVLYSGNINKNNFIGYENVYFIVEKKIKPIEKILFFFKFAFNFLKTKKKNFINFLFYFSLHNIFRLKMKKLYDKFLHSEVELLLIPFEGQPFQLEAIKFIKDKSKKSKVIGYIHSYPSFPSHLIKKENYPDKLIVSSEDQFNFFKSKIIDKENITCLKSLRFNKKDSSTMINKIFLPIDFYSTKNILYEFKILLFDILEKKNLLNFKVCNHPASSNSSKHKKLSKEIERYIKTSENDKNFKNNYSIFIGSTGSILEALELGIEIYHITEEPIFEIYSNSIWDNLKVLKLSDKIFSYKLIKKNKSMLLGETINNFQEYITI